MLTMGLYVLPLGNIKILQLPGARVDLKRGAGQAAHDNSRAGELPHLSLTDLLCLTGS